MKQARNEELVEEKDQMLRSCNIIFHGVKESTYNDKEKAKQSDEAFVNFIPSHYKFSNVIQKRF